MTQGGKRDGAGRKPRFGADKTIAMRVPEPLKPLVDQWLADYRAIMDAVTRGDVAGAEVAARTHVEHVRTAIEQMHAAAPDRAVLKDGTTAPPS